MASSSYKFQAVVVGQPILTTVTEQVSTNSGNNSTYTDGINIDALIGTKIFLTGTVSVKNLASTASYARLVDINDGTVYQTFNLPTQGYSVTIDYADTFPVKCSVAGHVEQRIDFKLL